MTTQTSIIAQQTRLRQWAEQIRECRADCQPKRTPVPYSADS